MKCPLCDFDLQPGAKFCSTCGASEEQRAEALARKSAEQKPAAALQPARPASHGEQRLPTAMSDSTPTRDDQELGRKIDAAEVAEVVKDRAAAVQQQIRQQLDNPELLEKIPGRSLSIGALGLMAAALIIGQLPINFFAIGMGGGETLFYLLVGALVAVIELRAAGVNLEFMKKVPAKLQHPLLPPMFAILLLCQSVIIIGLKLTPMVFTLSALVFAYDQYRKARRASHGFNSYFDLSQLRSGYRAWLLVALVLAITSLFFQWSTTPLIVSGGYDYNYRYNSNIGGYAYKYEYNPVQSVFGGFALSGRAQEGVIMLLIFMSWVLLWASWKSEKQMPRWFHITALVLSGILVFGGVGSLRSNYDKTGRWLFAAAVLALGFAVYKHWKGEKAGQYDLAHVVATAKEKARAATSSKA